MANSKVQVYAPASMGNVGIGFDILGLAFRQPGDVVTAEYGDTPGVTISGIEGDGGGLSRDPAHNTASIAAAAVLHLLDSDAGVSLHLQKGLPLASGLGSSAASAVAGAVAVNALLGEPLRREELLPACLEGEAYASGYHADNVAPCLLGGITLVSGTEAGQIRQLPVPSRMCFALVTPAVAVPTAQARAVLPAVVPLKQMVAQTAGVARLIDALYRDDLEAAAAAMEADCIVEPARAHLMPLLAEVRAAAKRAGALALAISGAGPTLCAVCDAESRAEQVLQAMYAVYDEAGIGRRGLVTQVSVEGAQLLSAG